ncbi:MAG: DUF1349 domain-containing protein, partial [Chloroflexota bacterium]|nr:DUF1349 domain-containing protein [Chloroflexota bacterium]
NQKNSYQLLQNPTRLRIIASSSTDMNANENSAPLVSYPCRGDFEVYVRVESTPNQAYQFAGIGVRSIESNNVWLRIGRQSNGPTTSLVTTGNNGLSPQLWDAVSYLKSVIHLKIGRNKNLITLSYSDDKINWRILERDYLAPMSNEVEIFLISLSNSSNAGLAADFSDFALSRK